MRNAQVGEIDALSCLFFKSRKTALSLFFAVFAVTGIHGNAVGATGLPLSGNCRILDRSSLAAVVNLAWDQSRAVVARRGMEVPARLIGLREHSGGFKLSLLFDDPILGPSETVVFSMDLGGGVRYRIGSVSYHILTDGTRVLSSIWNFEEAHCEVR